MTNEDHPLYLKEITLADGRKGTVVHVHSLHHFEVETDDGVETIKRVRMGEGAVRPASDWLTSELINQLAATPYDPAQLLRDAADFRERFATILDADPDFVSIAEKREREDINIDLATATFKDFDANGLDPDVVLNFNPAPYDPEYDLPDDGA